MCQNMTNCIYHTSSYVISHHWQLLIRVVYFFFFLISAQFIPMPVLYGVFLYMGVASLNGIQVMEQEEICKLENIHTD